MVDSGWHGSSSLQAGHGQVKVEVGLGRLSLVSSVPGWWGKACVNGAAGCIVALSPLAELDLMESNRMVAAGCYCSYFSRLFPVHHCQSN